MKRVELEKRMSELGWTFRRHGSNHDIWQKGKEKTQIPRHTEIPEPLAKAILKRAEN